MIDEDIINALKKRKNTASSVDAISAMTGIESFQVNKKLEILKKYNKVKPVTSKTMKFWMLVDD